MGVVDVDRRRFLREFGTFVLGTSVFGLAGCARALTESGLPEADRAVEKTLPKRPPAPSRATSSRVIAIASGGSPADNVRRAIFGLGGIERFVRPGDRVVVKPNLLTPREPEYATTTNPDVVKTIVALALEAGASDVLVFDHSVGSQKDAFDASGIGDAVRAAGGRIKVLSDRDFEVTAIPKGTTLKSWPLVRDVFEADVFINVPIAKTHGMAGLTLGMKNLMGIMGDPRGQIHVGFHEKIVDLYTLTKPHLTVLDAHRILVRNGPTGGSLRDVELRKTVIAGIDTVLVDATATALFGMKPEDLPYLVNAARRGLGQLSPGSAAGR